MLGSSASPAMLCELVFIIAKTCHCLSFIMRRTLLLLYMDDIIVTASSSALLQWIISSLHSEFSMIHLGPLNYFHGIYATCTTFGLFFSQSKYASEILERACMLNCNPCRTPVDSEKKLRREVQHQHTKLIEIDIHFVRDTVAAGHVQFERSQISRSNCVGVLADLGSGNGSLKFQVQSLIKEQDNVKTEYENLFDSIKRTRTQTQGEINELIENVNQNTYAYADVRAQNQDLLITIFELKAKLKNAEKKSIAPKTEEKHVLSKTVTLQTSPNKQQAIETNKNIIAPGMYKVKKTQNPNTNKAKSVFSIGLRSISSVRRPSHRDSSFKNSVLSNTKNSSEKKEVSDRIYKKSDVASKNVYLNKKILINDDIKNALIAKNVLCVSRAKNVLIPCHDNCLAKYKLNMHSKVRRALFTSSRTIKSKFEDLTPVVTKTRFSVKTVQSKSLDTTHVVSKTKIVTVTLLSAKHKIFMGTVGFGNDHFTAITGYDDYVQGNITVCHVYFVEGLGHNLFSVGQFCDGDLEVVIRSKSCYVQNLEGYDLLTGDHESNLYTISIFDVAASSHVCLMSKATSTKSWLWLQRLSHLNFEPGLQRFINDDSSAESMNIPSKEDLDNLFGPMYKEYFEKRSS
nr:ribonuclease H-like domain-containing protein [Tanacetum cinerariifolium]